MIPNLDEAQKKIREIIAQKKDAKRAGSIPIDSPQAKLPFWEEPSRGIPSFMFRSALFAAIRSEKRVLYKSLTKISSLKNMQVLFKGEQLNQYDLDVFEQIMHLISKQDLGEDCKFSAYDFLLSIGKTPGGKEYRFLNESIDRLCSAYVKVVNTKDGKDVFGTLISGGEREHGTHKYVITGNKRLKELYDFGWTKTTFEERLRLKKKPLALWLHGWFSSHAEPFAYDVATYKNLTGSQNSTLRGFKRELTQALDVLQANGFIKTWLCEGNMIYVNAIPSKSQRTHLQKKALLEQIKNS